MGTIAETKTRDDLSEDVLAVACEMLVKAQRARDTLSETIAAACIARIELDRTMVSQ